MTLPRANADRLVVYVLGAGVGESVVVGLPDGRTLVMDAAVADKTNLPASLLRALGVKQIDLLVLSHPDLDHVRGFAALIADFNPKVLWRYPVDASARDFMVRWYEDAGYADLATALRAVDDHLDRTGALYEAAYGHRDWPLDGASYRVVSLAPTPSDRDRAMRVWDKLLKFDRGRARVTRLLKQVAKGKARLGDAPNVVSLALAIEWGEHRIVLGGDAMKGLSAGPRAGYSGWKGILNHLDEDNLGHLVDDARAVKIAHHGSWHSFESTAWKRHAKSGKTVGLVTLFQTRLPAQATLKALRAHARIVGMPKRAAPVDARFTTAKWTSGSSSHQTISCNLPVIGVVIERSGGISTFGAPDSCVWS